MSMSFAQEYLYQKDNSNKIVNEVNISDDVSKMFNLISNIINNV